MQAVIDEAKTATRAAETHAAMASGGLDTGQDIEGMMMKRTLIIKEQEGAAKHRGVLPFHCGCCIECTCALGRFSLLYAFLSLLIFLDPSQMHKRFMEEKIARRALHNELVRLCASLIEALRLQDR